MDVASLAETKKTQDIVDITNQSSKEGIRIVIELRKDADVENFKNMLYKKTRLEDTFGVNMLACFSENISCAAIILDSLERNLIPSVLPSTRQAFAIALSLEPRRISMIRSITLQALIRPSWISFLSSLMRSSNLMPEREEPRSPTPKKPYS